MKNDQVYVAVIIPLALPMEYTYSVPKHLVDSIDIGVRVEVALKRKLYSGIVCLIGDSVDSKYAIKDIISILDPMPILSDKQLDLWKWVANYYCCTLGEVMHAALPSGLKLESETKIVLKENANYDFSGLNDDEYLVAEALTIRNELTIQEISEILNKKTIYPIIRSLLDKQVLEIKEELIQKYSAKKVRAIQLSPEFTDQAVLLQFLDDKIRSEGQERAILAYLTLSKSGNMLIPVSDIYEMARVNGAILKALEKKGVFTISKIDVSRLKVYSDDILEVPDLSIEQVSAIAAIKEFQIEKKPVLIHGITGSGKTRVYIELISEQIKLGNQCLYLLPEIALTTQIVERLEHYFGDDIAIYHSRMNNSERVETWNAVMSGKKVILGARSSLFLPFQKLGLIIVDEEHDPSYKQTNPSPRYNARDTSVVLARMTNASVILGSATPSIESYTNAVNGKYGLITINKRYGNSVLPIIKVVDLKREKKVGLLKDTSISKPLEDAITDFLSRNKQVIIFQNRRGFAPTIQCNDCGWIAECVNCDVTLTLHRYFKELRCHYCGHRTKNPAACPDCGGDNIFEIGQGTERIEEDLKLKFPEAVIKRMDHDTAKTKKNIDSIIYDFSTGKTDILVGTQMVTKGFDFDHLGLVGIINADSLTRFPDFRASERAFQMLTQVAGRAGRRGEQGLVIIQAFTPEHPTIEETIHYKFDKFYQREMHERKQFHFPPFLKLIYIELKHSNADKLKLAAEFFTDQLKKRLGHRVHGPIIPSIGRIKNKYIQFINIKIEPKPKVINFTKKLIIHTRGEMQNIQGIKGVRVNIDVDPY